MKNKIRESDDALEFLTEKPSRKKRQERKSKFKQKRPENEETQALKRKKRLATVQPVRGYEDDWDDDDQILFEWRREGAVSAKKSDPESDDESEEPSETE